MIAAAVLGIVLAGTGQDAPRLSDDTPHGASEWYLRLVQRYRSGDHRGAVFEPFPPEKVLFEVSALARLAEAAERCRTCPLRHTLDAFPFESAVLLHTDRAYDRFDRYDTSAQAELELAERLVAIMPEERRHAFEPRWLRAAALRLNVQGNWDLALRLLASGVRRYVGDPWLELARGATLEASSRLGSASRADQRKELAEAAECYARALARTPDLHEARVRRGRVLQLLGRNRPAVAELEAALAAGTGPRQSYLAHLFLGAAHEADGRPARAVAEYREAVRVLPDAQSAGVALSHALHRAGDWPHSVSALRAGVASAGRRAHVDPWWPYLAGQSEDAEALMRELREEAAR